MQWRLPFLKTGWKTGLVLLLIFTGVRFFMVLSANATGNYQNVSLIFLALIALPFLCLKKAGRKAIGLKKVSNYAGLLLGVLIGLVSSSVIFWIFQHLSILHPYEYIARTYKNLPTVLGEQRFTFFFIYSAISMTFSPFGEEFFYRGLIHENFRVDLGEKLGTFIDSAAFALVHIAHYGLIYTASGNWQFLWAGVLIWVCLLFFTCLAFNWVRKATGSIYGAVVAHACFNLGMNYFIFFYIL